MKEKWGHLLHNHSLTGRLHCLVKGHQDYGVSTSTNEFDEGMSPLDYTSAQVNYV